MSQVKKRASINDVATRANVSVGTVSNVLNRPNRVSPRTRDKVNQAIVDLEFIPNSSARQLRSGEVSIIGALVLDISNPYFTAVIRGMEDRLAKDGYALMLASSDRSAEKEKQYFRMFEEHGIRGVIAVPASDDMTAISDAKERGHKIVLLDVSSPAPQFSSVGVDNTTGGDLAVSHLIAQGHTRIAFINGPHSIIQCKARSIGAQNALARAGLSLESNFTEFEIQEMTADSGEQAAISILKSLPKETRPTAIFCVNDLVALGVARAFRKRSVAVPQEIALVGYDDLNFAGELATPLSSIRQPTYKIGYRAAELLIAQLQNGDSGDHEQVQFQPELIARESSIFNAVQ
ncbi:LacI family DNA-binding transcriptional regulator [Jonesiaceae bacterium BS-20]|uniref:LacI family DNA-binding transcriptional regulator n=1 Tax=Jonesiaceae bacterium BS-20 TaxID=3120821 RepID=A0AAU7DV63_9MICO